MLLIIVIMSKIFNAVFFKQLPSFTNTPSFLFYQFTSYFATFVRKISLHFLGECGKLNIVRISRKGDRKEYALWPHRNNNITKILPRV